MIHNLTGKDKWSLGRFRIEVTFEAPFLSRAPAIVAESPLLQHAFWLGTARLGGGPLSPAEMPPTSMHWSQGDGAIRNLFELVHDNCNDHSAACKSAPGNSLHRYSVHNSRPSGSGPHGRHNGGRRGHCRVRYGGDLMPG